MSTHTPRECQECRAIYQGDDTRVVGVLLCPLHAAAPALLEALVSAESAMMEAYPYVVDTPSNEAVRWTMRAMLDAIKQARAAIAQAGGEKS